MITPAADPVRVVIAHWDARPLDDLVRLLDQLTSTSAGGEFEVLVVVNQTRGGPPPALPPRHAGVRVLVRENTGMNIGAWEAGWRLPPARPAYLFLQDECQLVRPGWLAAFSRRGAERGVGLVGERMNPAWDAPWPELEVRFAGHRLPDHHVGGRPAERLAAYRDAWSRWGVPLGGRGDHLQSLVLFARHDVLARIGGLPVGRDKGEAIAAEVAISKRVQAAGLALRLVGDRPFAYFSHPQWAGRDVAGDDEVVRVFVGTDRSQLLAVRVLAHSLRRHTGARVEVTPLLDVVPRDAKDPAQRRRTGFSFARFAIPALCERRGRAIYLDADMLVFGDITELWRLDFGGAKVIVQEDLTPEQARPTKPGAPARRIRQWAVMVLDCARLDWDVDRIIDGLDEGAYTYDQLMHELCIMGPDEVRQAIPFRWNSLERLDESTRLIHYTDMSTQPWVSATNPNDDPWLDEVRLMIEGGALTWGDLRREVELGHFRPSLPLDVRARRHVPGRLRPAWRAALRAYDRRAGFVAHREVMASKARRLAALAGRAT